jgi:arylsulfatase
VRVRARDGSVDVIDEAVDEMRRDQAANQQATTRRDTGAHCLWRELVRRHGREPVRTREFSSDRRWRRAPSATPYELVERGVADGDEPTLDRRVACVRLALVSTSMASRNLPSRSSASTAAITSDRSSRVPIAWPLRKASPRSEPGYCAPSVVAISSLRTVAHRRSRCGHRVGRRQEAYSPSGMSLPDIVLMMTDQQRHDQVGYASEGFYETPALDALAARGVVFGTAYSAAATCVPARIGLLTGIQPKRLPRRPPTFALEPGAWTLAHALRDKGYETALFGKMHFNPVHADHGFDVLRTSEHLNASVYAPAADGTRDVDDYHQWLVDEGLATWRSLEVGRAPEIEPIQPPAGCTAPFPYDIRYHATSWIENEVRRFLDRRRSDRPLFLVVSFPHPHPPLNALDPYASRYRPGDVKVPSPGFEVNEKLPAPFVEALAGGTAQFGNWRVSDHGEESFRLRLTKVRALVRHIDDVIGQVLMRFPPDRSYVAFTSDHGDYGGHRGLANKAPWIPFDDLLRVPLVVTGPGVARGRRVDALVQSSDLALTFCDAAGIDVPHEEFDGRSLWPLISEGAHDVDDDRTAWFLSNPGWPGVRCGSLKLIGHFPSGTCVLFDVEADPDESVNLAADAAWSDELSELRDVMRTALHRPAPRLPSYGVPTQPSSR